MEATSVAVILLFVFTIFSGIRGDIPKDTQGLPAVSVTRSADHTGISSSYLTSVNSETRDMIDRYVRPRAKKISVEEASEITDAIMRYSEQYDVNPKLVAAMIGRESGFDPQSVSSSNAQGLAQLLPSTAAHIGIRDPFSIDEGTKGAVLYLKMMLDKWVGYPNHIPLALASYAEGPNQIARANGTYSDKTARYIDDIISACNSIN